MANKLNIPKTSKESKFSSVDFVENMSTFQLKTFIKNMWENMGELANAMDDNGRTDFSNAIDQMREGNNWSTKKFRDRFRYALHGSTIILYDSVKDSFKLLDDSGATVDYKAMNQKDITKHVKAIAKGKA
jgi:hypothetical protein